MRKFDPVRIVPFVLVPVLVCFLYDLTRVDPPPSPAVPQVPNLPVSLEGGPSRDVWHGDALTMEDYVPLALLVMAPFGLGVLWSRRTPGVGSLLLAASTFLSLFLLNLDDHHWTPAVFP